MGYMYVQVMYGRCVCMVYVYQPNHLEERVRTIQSSFVCPLFRSLFTVQHSSFSSRSTQNRILLRVVGTGDLVLGGIEFLVPSLFPSPLQLFFTQSHKSS
jgi:hypothetical protein